MNVKFSLCEAKSSILSPQALGKCHPLSKILYNKRFNNCDESQVSFASMILQILQVLLCRFTEIHSQRFIHRDSFTEILVNSVQSEVKRSSQPQKTFVRTSDQVQRTPPEQRESRAWSETGGIHQVSSIEIPAHVFAEQRWRECLKNGGRSLGDGRRDIVSWTSPEWTTSFSRTTPTRHWCKRGP